MNEPYSLRCSTSDQIIPKHPDPLAHGWYRTHYFLKGWGWKKGGIDIYDFHLRSRGITNWLSVSEEMKNSIAQEVKKEREETLKAIRNSPPIEFNQPFVMPVIKNVPPLNLNELVQVQPIKEIPNGTN